MVIGKGEILMDITGFTKFLDEQSSITSKDIVCAPGARDFS